MMFCSIIPMGIYILSTHTVYRQRHVVPPCLYLLQVTARWLEKCHRWDFPIQTCHSVHHVRVRVRCLTLTLINGLLCSPGPGASAANMLAYLALVMSNMKMSSTLKSHQI